MSKYNYPRFKIIIDPDSKKTQGLRTGDVVRRQYFDNPNLIYSLMIVLDTGTDIIRDKESHYFIGGLIEGDEPKQGELLDFVRVTSLFNKDRSGALYLTASDSQSPFMDVIDGIGTERSLCLMEKARRIAPGEWFEYPIKGTVTYPERLVVSYKIRGSNIISNVPLTIGYANGDEIDGADSIGISPEWQYKLSVITIDYPSQYARVLRISPTIQEDEWCEISDLNIIKLSDITTFSNATKARIGKITGIIDPIFGLLEGYGAYFQNLYATRNINIAGTLTAGDQNGFASTFYVGKIHKNVVPDSILCKFSNSIISNVPTPIKIGRVVQVESDTRLQCQSADWRMQRIGKQYTFSIWIQSPSKGNTISVYQDEHYIKNIEIENISEWQRCKISFIVQKSENDALYIGLKSNNTRLLLTAPQLESGENISQYQPTDEKLSYVEDYGAWFNRGGVGGTIQNPLLRLNEDGSISSRDDSFVINPDGTGHFAKGKFKWTKDDIELTDMTIRWGELDDETKEHILSQAQPSNIQAFVTSNLSITQIYSRENNKYQPNWAITPLLLTPSLFISTYGQEDLITKVADQVQKTSGIKPGSALWYKNGKVMISGQDSCTIENSENKYELRIKANHIGMHSPYIRYSFQAIWMDSNGNETPVCADIQFSLLVNPAATVVAVAYAPNGNIFRSNDKQNLRAHCDMWRGSALDTTNAEYHWGIKDDSVFANAQLATAAQKGSNEIVLRSVSNMFPGTIIYLIGKNPHTIRDIDVFNKTVILTTPLTRDYVVNTIVTTPLYDPVLGAGWAVLNETNPRGIIAGWNTNEITITPDAVLNFETFKCAIKDTNMNIGNGFAGQIACDIITFTDLSDPYYTEIIGTKGFVIKNDENDIEAQAVLYRTGNEVDADGTLSYHWKLYNADGTEIIRSYQGKFITVSRKDIIDRGALMCEIYEINQLISRGQISITRLYDGEDTYALHIISNNGNSFINGNITTTLTAHVYKGAEEVTDTIPDNLFNWIRVSDNPDGDIVWSSLHTGAGPILELSNEDVYRRATFTCEVSI